MAFENVNVLSLKNALNKCKSTLNYNITNELISELQNHSSWRCDASKNLLEALNKLKNEKYKDIKDRIDSYLGAVDKIEKYKILEDENEQLSKQYSSLSDKLYYKKYYYVEKTNYYGEEIREKKYRYVMDYSVNNQMKDINQRIINNENEMNSLKNQVSNII